MCTNSQNDSLSPLWVWGLPLALSGSTLSTNVPSPSRSVRAIMGEREVLYGSERQRERDWFG